MATRPAAGRGTVPAHPGGDQPARSGRELPGLPTPFAERVLDLVTLIPRGRVMAYGDIAAALGAGGPRQVGNVMSRWGGGVPWHRVVRASGYPAECHDGQAMALLRRERTPLSADGSRIDMTRARWHPEHLPDDALEH